MGLSESSKQALEAFTGMRLHRSNLPVLAYDLNALEVLADRVRTLLVPELAQVIKVVGAAGEGEVFDRFVAQTAPFVELLDGVADVKVGVAQAMRGFLNQMELTDRQALVMFVFMMTELAVAFAMAFVLPVEAAAHIVKVRTIIQTILRSSMVRAAASSTAIQMLFMPGSSLLAQISMLADGLVPGVDWGQVGKQALYGLAVAGVTTAAGPALGRFAGVVGGGLAKFEVSDATRDLLTSLLMVPVSEVGLEVVGDVAASYIVDGTYDPGGLGMAVISGALSGSGELGASGAGAAARRVAVGLGFNPTRSRWNMPAGTGFTADGRPVAPVTPAPSTYQPEVDDPAGAGSGGPGPVPVPLVSAPSLSPPAPAAPEPMPVRSWSVPDLPVPSWSVPSFSVPLVPVPEWVAVAGALVVEQWQRFQRELVDHYGGLLAGMGQARQFLAALPVSVERVFAGWVDARRGDRAVAAFLSAVGLPAAALTEGYLTGVRQRAVARVVEALAFSGGRIPAEVRARQVIAGLPAEFDRQALRSLAHLAVQHHIDQYLAAGLPTGPGTPTGAGAVVPSAGVLRAVEGGVWSQVDRGVDVILGAPAVLPGVVAGPDAGQVSAVARVVRQAVTDLSARFSAVTVPGVTGPAAGVATVDVEEGGRVGGPTVPVMSERHTAAAAGLAQAQFTALARRYGVDPAGHAALVTSFQREWVDGYHKVLVSAGGSVTPGTADVVGALGTVPGGVSSRVGGMSIVDVVSVGDTASVSDVSVASGGVFSPDLGSRDTDSTGFRDTGSISDVSLLDESISADSGGLGERAVAATGPAVERIHDLASGGYGRASDAQLRRLAADLGIQAASPDGVLPRLFEVSRDVVMADTFSGVYFADPVVADLDAAADRTAAQALPSVEGWFTIAGHRNLAERLADDPVRQALFLRMITASPAWQHAVAQAQQRGGGIPDILLVWCDAAWRGPGQATSFGGWLRTQLRARRLMSSTHEVDQIPGELRPHGDEPVRSVLFSDGSVELFGPDLVEAVRTADIVENGQEPGVRWPDQEDFAAAGGRHRWAGNTSGGQSPDPAEGGDPSGPDPVSAAQWVWGPSRDPGAQLPGEDLSWLDHGGMPGPLDDPGALTASSWPVEGAGPAGPVPGIGVTDGHGAAMSTDFDQPSIDNQAGDGSGNLGDWATYQEPDMDWQPSLAPSPAVTRTDAGTLHAGDTLHHPAYEPPTTLAPLHPDQPQPTAGSRWVRDPDEARRLFEQHVGHIAPTTPQRKQLRKLWNALIDRMDDNGIITASGSDLAEATSAQQSTVHHRIGVLRDRGLLQLVQEGRGGGAARYGVSDPGQPRQAPLPALPEGSQWLRDPDEARALFDQHAGHIATTTPQREQLRQLWNALIDRMDDNGIITASGSDLAEATSTLRPTVHARIGALLRGSALLQLVQEGRGGGAARYGVSDPGQPRQAPLPALPADSRWVRDPDEARALFDQHADHIATTTRQREQLRQLWNALIDRMDDDGTITASEPDLAEATSTPKPTVHNRIGALRGSALLQLVQDSHGRVAARYGVSDPGQPRQAPLPAPPEGGQWLRDPGEARALFDQHAGHIATTTPQREQLRQLWNALIDRMDDNGIITASVSALAEATSTPRPTVHRRIGALRGSALLQLVQEGHAGGAARYRVSDPGQPRQAPLPGPALGPDRPQGEDLSWLDHGATVPMSGPAPAPPAGTGLPGLPRPLDDPDAPTASSWPAGWAQPGWPVPGMGVTDGHGAAMSTDFDQPGIDDQSSDGGNLGDWASEGGNLGDWATYEVDPAGSLDVDPADLLYLFEAVGAEPDPAPQPMDPPRPQAPPGPSWSPPNGDQPSQSPGTQSFPPGPGMQDPAPQSPMSGLVPASPAGTGLPGLPGPLDDPDVPTASSWPAVARTDAGTVHAGDTLHHPADEPPTTPASLHPDQPQPQPAADSRWVRDPGEARALFDQHAGHIAPTTRQREQLRQLWNALIDRMDDNGIITASESDLAEATSAPQPTVHDRIGVLRDRGLLQRVRESHGRVAARYGVSDPGQPQQAPLPALPADSRWVRDPDEARALFDQHAGHIAPTTRQREQLRQLWNALIDHMDDDGTITASVSALAEATSTPQRTVHRRMRALRGSALLRLVQEGRGGGAARYGVSDPGQPRQAPRQALPEGGQWLRDPGGARALFDQHAGHIAPTTRQREQLRQLWNALIDRMDDNGIITASESDLAEATSTPQPTVHDRIGVLRDRGLLQRVREGRGRVAARYGVSDPGQPRQAPLPGPALGPDRPQGEDLSWLDHGATVPMSGPAPASPAGTGLPGLPGPLDDPDAPTASSWPAGWAQPGWPVPGMGVTDGHGAAMSTDFDQPGIDDQSSDGGNLGDWAGEGGNLGDWATYEVDPAGSLDVDPADLLYPFEAVGTEPDPAPQPMDPPRPQAPPGPTSWSPPNGDQPSQSPGTQSFPPGPGMQDPAPQSPMSGLVPASPAGTGLPGLPGPLDDPDAPTASSWPAGWAEPGWPVPGMGVTDGHGAAMSTDFDQPGIDDQASDGGNLGDWASEGGNLGDWATYEVDPARSLDVDPADLLYLLEAVGTEPDPAPQPMDPPRPQAPPGPTSWSPPNGDQPSQSPGTQSFPPGPGMQDPAPQSPMSGLVPASPAGTGLPGLPGPLDDPDAPTASSWPAGWAQPGWPVPGMGVTDGHGAAMSTDFDQPGIDDQASDGGNLGDWATYEVDPAGSLDVDPADLLYPFEAVGAEPDPAPQPMDPPRPQAPPGPTSWSPPNGDQPSQFPGTQSFPPGPGMQDPAPQSPMSGLVPAPPAGTGLPGLPRPLDNPDVPTASSWPAVARTDAGTVHAGDTLHHPADEPPTTPASLHPDQPQPQPQPAAGSRWVRDPGEARALFDQHADHIATTTPQREQLRQLWNALIDRMDDNGIITASESDLAEATSAPQPTVHDRIGVLRGSGLLQRVRESHGRGAARYGVSDPGQPQQAPLPALPADSRWVRDPDEARALFDQHADHIASTTRQREQLRQLWNALIDHMDDDGTITASVSALAEATSTPQRTVHRRMRALRGSALLRLVQEGRGGGAARYGVSDPGQPRQAPRQALPEGGQWLRDPGGARALFDQHAGHIAPTTPQREQLRQLWNALIDRMDDNGIITASESDLAEATSTPQPTVHDRIGVLRDRGLLQRVREGRGRVAARYGVSDPGQPRQAPLPGPALGPDRPQGEDLSWLDHGATVPMSGPAPAPPAGTGLPGLPRPLDDPDAPTASSWPAGWAQPGWPVPGMGVTDGHGAAMSTDFDQPGIDDQASDGGNLGDWASEGGNLGDWATYEVDPARSLDVDPADLLYLLEAVGTEPDPAPQPMDPPRPQAPPGPTSWSPPNGDQPSQSPGTQSFPPGPGMQDPAPQSPMSGLVPASPAGTGLPGLPGPLDDPDAPTASSWPAGWAEPGWPVPGMGVTDGHGAAMSTDFDQPGIDDQASDGGNLGDWAGEGGNLGDWATYEVDAAGSLDVDPADLLYLLEAVGAEPDPGPQPMDPPRPQAPPGPSWSPPNGDQPSQSPGTQSFPPGPGMQDPAPQSPMSGLVPASPAGTGLPGLPGPLDDPDAPTASSWPAGWAEPGWAEPGWPVPGMGVTDGHGAAMSTDFDQPGIDDQASDGGNLGDWATYEVDPARSLDVDPADLLYLLEAVGTEPDPAPQPMDPPRPQAPPGPTSWSPPNGDQPSQSPGTQSFPPGPGMQDPAPQSPMSGLVPAPPAGTGLPGLPGPLDDPDAPTASSWPAVARTDAGTVHAGDTLHHPADEPPTTPASPQPDQPQPQPQPAAGSRRVRDPGEARALFDQHAGHIATTTPQREQLRQLWNALIDRMDDNGIITASESDLAEATSTLQPTVHARIGVLRDRGLLQRVREGRGGVAARYGVSDPGQPRQAPLPAPPADSRWVRDPDEARALFDQHAGHIATTTPQREQLRQLWNALIDRMDDNGIITASESDLAEATSAQQSTVHRRIGALLRGSALLQLVQEGHGRGAARYGVSDPGQPRQAPLPAPPEGSRWLRDPGEARALFDQHADHIATTTPQREQLQQLWNALIDRMDDNGIITASESDLAEATSAQQPTVHHRIGVLRDRGLLQRVQESRGGGAARYGVSDPGQPRQAPLPAPPEGSQWLRDPDGARALFDQHAGRIATTTRQREQLRQLWNALIDRMDDNGIITASESDLAEATSAQQSTVHRRIGALLRGSALLQLVQEGHGRGAARYGVSDPGQPRQAPLPAPPEGSRWLRDPGEARALFDQHAGHIATTTPQREQLRQLWNALIDRMDDNGIITASEPDLAEATSTLQPTVHARIGVLRGSGLLQRVREGRGGVAARYGVSDPGQPRRNVSRD
ncbi:hypothetical protein [Micromonospora inyonensis]|uniref:hypothetical protein n=1 Tax=Micromonospora inyonensis TaxID=47866 RepID=UPI000B892305|nr:hypothetical protein [Micromonospora inyonensis]